MILREALTLMDKCGELERVYAYANFVEKFNVKHDIDLIKKYANKNGSNIELLMNLKSIDVLKNAICYLEMRD